MSRGNNIRLDPGIGSGPGAWSQEEMEGVPHRMSLVRMTEARL